MFILLLSIFQILNFIFGQEQDFQLVVNKNCTDIELYKYAQNNNPGEVPTNALFFTEMQNMINNKINIDKNIRVDDCEIKNQQLLQLKYVVFFYLGKEQKILVDNKEQDWFVFQKYLILVAQNFEQTIQEGSIISIYNPYTESFQELLVTRKNARDIQQEDQPDQQQNKILQEKQNDINKQQDKKKTYLQNIKTKLKNYDTLIDLPKDGGYILYMDQNQQKENSIVEQLTINENEIQNEEKIYNYYFPSLTLEQGIIPKDAIREIQIVQNQIIRKLFPPENQNWTLFYFIKSHYHSIEGKPIFIPFYIKDATVENNEGVDYDKIQIQQEFLIKVINVERVDKKAEELVLRKQFMDPPFQFMDQFMNYEDFINYLTKNNIKIFLKTQQLMYFEQISKSNQSVKEILDNCFALENSDQNNDIEQLKVCANLCVGSIMLKLESNKRIEEQLYTKCKAVIQKTKPLLLNQYKLQENEIPFVPKHQNFTQTQDYTNIDNQ